MNKKCLKCDKSFDSKRSLRDHINEDHSMTINCKLCDKHFSRSCDLEEHINMHHGIEREFECVEVASKKA